MSVDNSISVVVPVYNVEEWLVECLDSIVGQTSPFDQIIVVDDGSTDKSGAIADSYSIKYPVIEVIHQENKGLGGARNVGLDKVESEYTLFVDSDDYLAKDTCESLKRLLKKYPGLDGIGHEIDAINEMGDFSYIDGKKYRRNLGLSEKPVTGLEFFKESILNNYVVNVGGFLYKTALVKEIGFLDRAYYEDNYTNFVFLSHAKTISYLNKTLFYYRIRKGSITNVKTSLKHYEDLCEVTRLIYNHMLDNTRSYLEIKDCVNKYAVSLFISSARKYCDVANGNNADVKFLDALIYEYTDIARLYAISAFDTVRYFNSSVFEMLLEIINCITNNEEKNRVVNDIKNLFLILYVDIYKKSGFDVTDAKKNYAVYGVGKHTLGMLRMAELLFGNIKAGISYFVSEKKENNDLYVEKGIHCINELDEKKYDAIVVSSCIFREAMKKNIKDKKIHLRVIDFYAENNIDVFSWLA